MSSLIPIALYALKVPAGGVKVPASQDVRHMLRITMAAIDPSTPLEHSNPVNGDGPARSTLKLGYDPSGIESDEDSEDDSEVDNLKALLEAEDDEDESSSDEEKNGGPSDPSRSKKARQQAAAEQALKALAEDDSDENMDIDGGANGGLSKVQKGKRRAKDEDESDDGDNDEIVMEYGDSVLCTLDFDKHYQQPLDLTIDWNESAYFTAHGTHTVYLTGNYVIPAATPKDRDYEDSEDDEESYDLTPDSDELDDEEESDELDGLEDPRITELPSDDEEVPQLTPKKDLATKGKNKRAADDSDSEKANLDDIMAKALKPEESSTNGEPKLSKRQLKKQKNNVGKAVDHVIEKQDIKKADADTKDTSNGKADKKVQFAKNLEQGPSNAPKDGRAEAKAETRVNGAPSGESEKQKPSLGVKTVQGVKIDDRKLGSGPPAKKGSKVGLRYIGKLTDGKVFDANKKGRPFSFTVGLGEVVKGLDIGIAGMSIGGERRVTIPAHLGYGSKAQKEIPANSTLVFEIKLLEIK